MAPRHRLTRRALFGAAGTAGALALVGGGARLAGADPTSTAASGSGLADPSHPGHSEQHAAPIGRVDPASNGFDPHEILRDFDEGKITRLPGGRVRRDWTLLAQDKEIEVAPGVKYAAWTYNGRVPGPTLRCTEGDLLRVRFVNGSSHPHTIHFHGFHPAFHDGVPGSGPGGLVRPGQEFTYEFEASPFGLHLYHCHSFPLAAHIAKGLYGTFIVDPKEPRAEADEMVMVMNAFDTNFDGGNEVYAVNTVGFAYFQKPIAVERERLVRIYLSNLVEFDPINSFHLHANFFDYYPTGTRREPSEFTDIVSQVQGQRGILEIRFPFPGTYMFHAHKTEFAELGWTGFFEVS